MLFMLMDHLWATLLPAQDWLTCVGRVAFPIFAFMAVEGYFHTHSFKKYAQRLLVFALLSEIPFDLMYGGTWFYPVHQNVIWTFLLGLSGIHLMETVHKKQKPWAYVTVSVVAVSYTHLFYRGEKLGKTYNLSGIISKRRNELIANILVACNVMEAAGTGFDKIIEEYKDANEAHKPYIYSSSDHFTLVLPDLTYDSGLEDANTPVLTFVPVPNGTELDEKVLSFCYLKAVSYTHLFLREASRSITACSATALGE